MSSIHVGNMVQPSPLSGPVSLCANNKDMKGVVLYFEGSIGDRAVCIVRWGARVRYSRNNDPYVMAHYVDQLERVLDPDSLEGRVALYVDKELNL